MEERQEKGDPSRLGQSRMMESCSRLSGFGTRQHIERFHVAGKESQHHILVCWGEKCAHVPTFHTRQPLEKS